MTGILGGGTTQGKLAVKGVLKVPQRADSHDKKGKKDSEGYNSDVWLGSELIFGAGVDLETGVTRQGVPSFYVYFYRIQLVGLWCGSSTTNGPPQIGQSFRYDSGGKEV